MAGRLMLLAAAAVLAGCGANGPGAAPVPKGRTLQPFRNEAEFAAYTREVLERARRIDAQAPRPGMIDHPYPMYPLPQPPAPPDSPRAPVQSERPRPSSGGTRVAVDDARADEHQTATVHGDYLVVLHRGRLFTVRIGGGALDPVSAVEVFAGENGASNWTPPHDQLLVAGDDVVVIRRDYSYEDARIGLYHVAPDGRLTHRATHLMSSVSADINGTRRYVSLLAGGKLVFYAPLSRDRATTGAYDAFPTFFRLGSTPGRRPSAVPTRVYRPASVHHGGNLHTVTVCDLPGDELRCHSTALFAPFEVRFHVAPAAVYLWARQHERWWDENAPQPSVLYRLPLDGSAPTALRVAGEPVDDLSFHESNGHIHVLVRMDAAGARTWGADYAPYRLALLRVPVTEFGDGTRAAARERYRALPTPPYGLGVRFVGDWLLYGRGQMPGWEPMDSSTAYAVPLDGGNVSQTALPHAVDRTEAMGSGAAVIGGNGRELHVSVLRLGPGGVAPAGRYTLPGVPDGLIRAQDYFYRPEGDDAGVMALSLLGPARPGARLRLESARLVFARNDHLQLRDLGELASSDPAANDACAAACGRWYDNTRPFFVGERILALLGYEVVEGREEGGRIREVRRVSFAPVPAPRRAGP